MRAVVRTAGAVTLIALGIAWLGAQTGGLVAGLIALALIVAARPRRGGGRRT